MKREIKVESTVQGPDGPVSVDDLDRQQKDALSRWLRETYFAELYRGEAQVRWAEPEKGSAEEKKNG